MRDEAIIRAIKNQNEAVIDGVITKYSRLLWSVSGRVLQGIGSQQDIEECVADAFIQLWEHPDQFDPRKGSLKTWLTIVARSRAIDRSRELLRHDALPFDEAALAADTGELDDFLERDERRELRAAVDELGEPEREIILRRYCRGQKPREIALALCLPVKQVDNHLYRAKCKLRKKLSD